jgi:hypothetical protein
MNVFEDTFDVGRQPAGVARTLTALNAQLRRRSKKPDAGNRTDLIAGVKVYKRDLGFQRTRTCR